MPSQPEEKPSEDIRTALQLLNGGWMSSPLGGTVYFGLEVDDLRVIQARLAAALAKLDATTAEERAIGRREQELGIMLDRAAYIAREYAQTEQPVDYPLATEDGE